MKATTTQKNHPQAPMTGQYDPVPSLDSFLAGKPERILATKKPKIAITWLHTNEDNAPTVAHAIYSKYPHLAAYISYICGNPLTAETAPEKGFTENDLNRNFIPNSLANPQTYEEHRAATVLQFIQDADYVLDLHNTVCTNFGKIIIVKDSYLNEPRIRDIIAASPLTRILAMNSEVADATLIGDYGAGAKGVTLEYELSLTQSEAVPDTIATIESLITGNKKHRPFEREVFRMIGTIPKQDDPGLETKNFEPFIGPDGTTCYAAFLGTGPRSYREDSTKDYCGFYATMERMVI